MTISSFFCKIGLIGGLHPSILLIRRCSRLRNDENFVDYGKYLRCDVVRFWRILQEERVRGAVKTLHHVFTGNLKRGAWKKNNLSKNRLEFKFKKYRLNMDEVVFLDASIHSVLNQLLRNNSPPVIFANLNCIFDSEAIDRHTKEYFTKFVLYIVAEKLKRRIDNREYHNLEEINKLIENIGRKSDAIKIDVNDGNKKDAEFIMSLFEVTRDEIIHFLVKNFLPKDWTKYPDELWDLSLRR